jgi:hypothetical protein
VVNHPGYHDILIVHDALSQLPEDDSAADRVMTANTERETDSPNLTRTASAERAQPDNAELAENLSLGNLGPLIARLCSDDARVSDSSDHDTTHGNEENGGDGDEIMSDIDVILIQSQPSFSSMGSSVR